MTKRNLIFLDFDGVLNSVRSCVAYADQTGYEPEGLDQVAVLLIKELCLKASAEIVISSTWRKHFPVDRFIKIFAVKGWHDAPVIGMTPSSVGQMHGKNWGFRGNEVGKFLDNFVEQGNEVGNWVCIDDSKDFHIGETSYGGFYSKQPCVFVDEINGFNLKNFYDALKILCPEHNLLTQLEYYGTR